MKTAINIFLSIAMAFVILSCGGGSNGGSKNKSSKDTTSDQEKKLPVLNDKVEKPKDTKPLPIKKTGQTKSYNQSGEEVTDGSIKDDGYYQKGATPHYTRDDAKEIVTDTVTGLQWQDDRDAKTVKKNWQEAIEYCADLTLGGHSDWRLPTIAELRSIVDKGRHKPAIDPTFQNVGSDDWWSLYWSSTTYAYDSSSAWFVFFNDGSASSGSKGNSVFVRCVR